LATDTDKQTDRQDRQTNKWTRPSHEVCHALRDLLVISQVVS